MITPVITDASTTNPILQAINAGSYSERRQASEAVPLLYGLWYLNVIRRVFGVSRVPRDWDSYGSVPPTDVAADRAIDIVTHLAVYGADELLPTPDVFPVPGGGIRIEWQNADKELAVDVLPDGSLEFLQAENAQVMAEGELVWNRIPALLEWFASA